ncbi:MAG TPA: hypothetical protein PKE13_09790 [Hyphomicrobium zavarzinii]|nr:hypothetical protein [Hyphomicrobium zavarzinii]
MVSSFPLPGFWVPGERYEAQRDAHVAHLPRLSKERDELMVAPAKERRKRLPA